MTRGVIVSGVLLAAVGSVPARAQPPELAGRILVMPFASDRADSRAFWLGEASGILLAEDLRALGAAAITRDERRQAFERLQVPMSASLTDATVIRIGQVLGAGQIIMGSLELVEDEMVVRARSIALDTARIQASASARGPLSEVFAVIERLARSMAPPASTSEAVVARDYPPVAAFELYVKGLLAETPVYAVNYLQNAIRQAPEFDRARLALWDVYNRLADHERALAVVEPVSRESAWTRTARFDAGLSLVGLERYEAASAMFGALADEQPTAAVLNNLGVVTLRRDWSAGGGAAAAYFERAAQADPDDPDYRFNAGYARWRAGAWPAAVQALREAVRRNPADADAHIVLSAALAADGNAAEASRERELAGRLSSDYERTVDAENLAVPEGLERLRGAVELPRQFTIEATLASSDARQQRALADDYLARGRSLFEQERDRDAVDLLNRAVFIAPYDAAAHLLLGRLHLRNGRPREAVDALKISLWSDETAEAHLVLARAYLDVGDRGASAAEAERALALDPALDAARDILAETADVP